MDLDISVDESGNPYLGHGKEYYEKTGEKQPEAMSFHKAIELISKSNIPVIVDCKHYNDWPFVEETIKKIGAHRCMVHSFVSELKFDYKKNEHNYFTEWSAIEKLAEMKNKFPIVTITASCKFLPDDFLLTDKHTNILEQIRKTLKNNKIETVCLNVSDENMTDEILEYFLSEKIIAHVNVDKADKSKLTKLYIGESDSLTNTSDCKILDY